MCASTLRRLYMSGKIEKIELKLYCNRRTTDYRVIGADAQVLIVVAYSEVEVGGEREGEEAGRNKISSQVPCAGGQEGMELRL